MHVQSALAGGGENAGHQLRAVAAATHGRVDLRVGEGHRAPVDVVAGQPHDLLPTADLEATPLGDVHHRHVHRPSSTFRRPGAVAWVPSCARAR